MDTKVDDLYKKAIDYILEQNLFADTENNIYNKWVSTLNKKETERIDFEFAVNIVKYIEDMKELLSSQYNKSIKECFLWEE